MSLALEREGVVELAEALEAVKLGSSKLLVLEDREGVGIVLKNDQLQLQVPGLAGRLADLPLHSWLSEVAFQFRLSSV